MILLIILMHAAFAAIFPIGRAARMVTTPLFFTGARMFIAGLGMLIFEFFRGTPLPVFNKSLIVRLSLFALFGIFLTNVAEMWGLQYVPSAKASFIYSLTPFVSALISYFVYHERMTIKKIIGMIIALTGFLIMTYQEAPGESGQQAIGIFSWGELSLVIAAISTAIGWLYMREMVRKDRIPSFYANGIAMICTSAVCFLGTMIIDKSVIPVSNSSAFMQYVGMAIIFSNIIGYGLYGYLLKQYTATLLSFVGFIEPMLAALYAWFLIGESVTIYFYISFVCVVIGLTVFYREELNQGYIIRQKQ